jgi:hypothetical protein
MTPSLPGTGERNDEAIQIGHWARLIFFRDQMYYFPLIGGLYRESPIGRNTEP